MVVLGRWAVSFERGIPVHGAGSGGRGELHVRIPPRDPKLETLEEFYTSAPLIGGGDRIHPENARNSG